MPTLTAAELEKYLSAEFNCLNIFEVSFNLKNFNKSTNEFLTCIIQPIKIFTKKYKQTAVYLITFIHFFCTENLEDRSCFYEF